MKIKEKTELQGHAHQSTRQPPLHFSKYYLQIHGTEILSVFASKSQNSKQSNLLHSTAA
jgi:hypothetical protein